MLSDYFQGFKSRRCLNELGYQQKRDVFYPDGMGGKLKIDRLVQGQHGISVVLFMPYEGNIFCADNIDEWTQMTGGKSYSFENPLNHLDITVNTVSGVVSVPVDGYLYFGHRASFPKGRPRRVISHDCLPEALTPPRKSKPDAAVMDAWNDLLEKAI